MNGPGHFNKAEDLLDKASQAADAEYHDRLTARAQVHATLAQVCAQLEDMEDDVLRPGWAEILEGGES
jgi:ElaB/YqjD/DUF883 family membrane-anchored ribosome-binding protein